MYIFMCVGSCAVALIDVSVYEGVYAISPKSDQVI